MRPWTCPNCGASNGDHLLQCTSCAAIHRERLRAFLLYGTSEEFRARMAAAELRRLEDAVPGFALLTTFVLGIYGAEILMVVYAVYRLYVWVIT